LGKVIPISVTGFVGKVCENKPLNPARCNMSMPRRPTLCEVSGGNMNINCRNNPYMQQHPVIGLVFRYLARRPGRPAVRRARRITERGKKLTVGTGRRSGSGRKAGNAGETVGFVETYGKTSIDALVCHIGLQYACRKPHRSAVPSARDDITHGALVHGNVLIGWNCQRHLDRLVRLLRHNRIVRCNIMSNASCFAQDRAARARPPNTLRSPASARCADRQASTSSARPSQIGIQATT